MRHYTQAHWQGGGGMRDTMRLSKKDSRHKDARWDTKKTVSRKAQDKKAGGGGGNAKSTENKSLQGKFQGSRNR